MSALVRTGAAALYFSIGHGALESAASCGSEDKCTERRTSSLLLGTWHLRPREDRALRGGLLDAASQGFDEVDMALHAACARWHQGTLRGGDEGGALVASAESWMTAQGIASPSQMSEMMAPGFRR